jgi:hypothetical protein
MTGRDDKGKIVFLGTFVTLVFVVLSIQSVRQFRESNRMREKDERVEEQRNLALALFKTDGDFFAYEHNNSEFYKSGESKFLTRHDSIITKLNGLFQIFSDEEAEEGSIAADLKQYDSIFGDIVAKIKERGYRDYGLEGKMRDKAHQIEKKKLLSDVDYLRLRRHEKDYLLRADSMYINKFDSLLGRHVSTNVAARPLLEEYSKALHDLASVSDMIGLETQSNLKANLDRHSDDLLKAIQQRDVTIDETIYEIHRNGILLFILGMIGSTIVCFSLIVIIIKRL